MLLACYLRDTGSTGGTTDTVDTAGPEGIVGAVTLWVLRQGRKKGSICVAYVYTGTEWRSMWVSCFIAFLLYFLEKVPPSLTGDWLISSKHEILLSLKPIAPLATGMHSHAQPFTQVLQTYRLLLPTFTASLTPFWSVLVTFIDTEKCSSLTAPLCSCILRVLQTLG